MLRATRSRKSLRSTRKLPIPDYRFGFFPPHWWLGIIIRDPDLEKITFGEANRPRNRPGKRRWRRCGSGGSSFGRPGAVLDNGHLTIGSCAAAGSPLRAVTTARGADQPLKCLSAQPGMGDVLVLGVVSREATSRASPMWTSAWRHTGDH